MPTKEVLILMEKTYRQLRDTYKRMGIPLDTPEFVSLTKSRNELFKNLAEQHKPTEKKSEKTEDLISYFDGGLL